MVTENRSQRVLIYSHDSYGLGHLSRCRTIANALVAGDENLSVLIISGSPMVGSFDFRARVDFVRVPGIIKLRNGEYDSLNLRIDVGHTIRMRETIIRDIAEIFDPHIFIVDKEPLGLRDVMDEPTKLGPEWQRKNVLPALRDLYDSLWVYGLPQINDPLAGISLPKSVRRKMVYTGYLRRSLPNEGGEPAVVRDLNEPYLLVTAGGGGDGAALVDWVLRAYEHDPRIPYSAIVVFGPFMQPEAREAFRQRADRLDGKVRTVTFEANLGALMAGSAGVIAMGGYNTFCEILSFDCRALIVPRTRPRLEQYIRAQCARAAGLANVLPDNGRRDPQVMATALRQLPQQAPPSRAVIPGLLDGLPNVAKLVAGLLDSPRRGPAAVDALPPPSEAVPAESDGEEPIAASLPRG